MKSLFASRYEEVALGLLRFMAGWMLAQHGAQKLFGWLGGYRGEPGGTAELLSRAWVAGVLEVFGGVLLAVGLFTRPVAFVLSGLMAAAYFIAHAGDGFWPLLNRGELAALYCFAFLYLAARGGGAYSLDALLRREPARTQSGLRERQHAT